MPARRRMRALPTYARHVALPLLALWLGALAFPSLAATALETTQCQMDESDPVSAVQRGLKARVTHTARRVNQVLISSYFSPREGLGFTCRIALRRDDPLTRWQTHGTQTRIIRHESADATSTAVITRMARAWLIDLRAVDRSGACGAGARLPSWIEIPLQGGACHVPDRNAP